MKYFKIILIVILALLVFGTVAGGYFLYQLNATNYNGVACTMEAKVCPDGSYVGRTGPNCEFSPCPTSGTSGMRGMALLGPMCPVIKDPPDPECADRPYKTDLIATSPDGIQIFQSFSSDESGKFSINLVPGDYVISSADTASIFSRCSSSGTIKVEQSKYTEITIYCDTGIR